MKILAGGVISGWVDAVDAGQGTIELGGITLHMEHGAVVSVGDFLEVDVTYSTDRVWSARICAQFGRPEALTHVSPQAHTPAAAATASGTLATGGAETPTGTPVAAAAGSTQTGAAGAPPAGAQTGTTGVGRGARYGGGSRPQGQRPSGPGAAGSTAKAESRPRFTPSSADQKVQY